MPALDTNKITEQIIYLRSLDINKAPAFQFYPGAWLDHAVTRLSYEAQGVFIRILALTWKNAADQVTIKADHGELSQSLGLTSRKTNAILTKLCEFPANNLIKISIQEVDFYVSPKLLEVRLKTAVYQLKQKKKADDRWKNKDTAGLPADDATGYAAGNPVGMPRAGESSLSLPSSLPLNNKGKTLKKAASSKKPNPQDNGLKISEITIRAVRQNLISILEDNHYWNKTETCQKRFDNFFNALLKETRTKKKPLAYLVDSAPKRVKEHLDVFKPSREESDKVVEMEKKNNGKDEVPLELVKKTVGAVEVDSNEVPS